MKFVVAKRDEAESDVVQLKDEAAPDRAPGATPVAGGLAFGGAPRSAATKGEPLPEELRAGIEQLSGYSLDQVSVHYNSALPAEVGAHAYTQGSEIHVGPGQEKHLPHEAWHVVQQAQGRVRPTVQLKGMRSINDESGLEHEADVMGARAQSSGGRQSTPRTPSVLRIVAPGSVPILQLSKFVVRSGDEGVIHIVPEGNGYQLKRGETIATKTQLKNYSGTNGAVLREKASILEADKAARKKKNEKKREKKKLAALSKAEATATSDIPVATEVKPEERDAADSSKEDDVAYEGDVEVDDVEEKVEAPVVVEDPIAAAKAKEAKEKASAARLEARKKRRLAVPSSRRMQRHDGKQFHFPVVLQGDGGGADLVYRGMSINNIKNFMQNDPVFKAQNPDGRDGVVKHIVDDSENSPYLSFEKGGFSISGGKYAPKPVDKETGKPVGITNKSGHLKGEKSYVGNVQDAHQDKDWRGYVGGIPGSPSHLDMSGQQEAFDAIQADLPSSRQSDKRKEKAQKLAVADKEVLVKPGRGGVDATFVAKIEVVDQDYYDKKVIHQTPTKALGFFRSYRKPPRFCKIQIVKGDYRFEIPKQVEHNPEDSESEVSDIEDFNMEGLLGTR